MPSHDGGVRSRFEPVSNRGRHEGKNIRDEVMEHARRLDLGPETERTVFFSDAVFAIAMTLLALDLRLPDLPSDITEQGFEAVLIDRLPSLAAFVLSFVLVGRTWLHHHRNFNAIRAYDNKLQLINLLVLFFVVFLPVPTALLFANEPTSPWPPLIYALTIVGLNLSVSWVWRYAHKAHLMEEWVDEPLYKLIANGASPTWLVFLTSIPIAFVNPAWAMYFWIVLWPASVIQGRLGMRAFVRAETARFAEPGPPRAID